jgi:hypothetical protein
MHQEESMTISAKTRLNWVLDAAVFIGAVAAGLSGIYFLYFPSGGYQGGRNPAYGMTLLFERHTWSNLHVWGGIAMILAVVIHLTYHWYWVRSMTTRMLKSLMERGSGFSRGGKINLLINLFIGLSFLVVSLSGVYFLFLEAGGYRGGVNSTWDPGFIFTRITWDLIHTWSGVALILAAMLHIVIHWRWIRNVTIRFLGSLAGPFRVDRSLRHESQRVRS